MLKRRFVLGVLFLALAIFPAVRSAYGGAVAGSLNSTDVISPVCEFTTMIEFAVA